MKLIGILVQKVTTRLILMASSMPGILRYEALMA